jgi:hypothetical protein
VKVFIEEEYGYKYYWWDTDMSPKELKAWLGSLEGIDHISPHQLPEGDLVEIADYPTEFFDAIRDGKTQPAPKMHMHEAADSSLTFPNDEKVYRLPAFNPDDPWGLNEPED